MRRLSLIAALFLLCPVAAAGAKAPVGKWYKRSVTLVVGQSYVVGAQGDICVTGRVRGKLRYEFFQHKPHPPENHRSFKWRNPALINPKISAKITDACTVQYPANRVRIADVEFKASIYGGGTARSCLLNPSFSFGLPWAISVGVTPECGDETNIAGQLWGRSSPAKPQSYFDQSTLGVAAQSTAKGHFDEFHYDTREYTQHCYQVPYEITTYRRSRGRTKQIKQQVCVNLWRIANR